MTFNIRAVKIQSSKFSSSKIPSWWDEETVFYQSTEPLHFKENLDVSKKCLKMFKKWEINKINANKVIKTRDMTAALN